MENNKYVVFKREDWQMRIKPALDMTYIPIPMNDLVLDDAVVIRPQDVFAGPGLWGYANAIQTWIEAIKTLNPHPLGREALDPEIEVLEDLREFFATQAQIADEMEFKKVPD